MRTISALLTLMLGGCIAPSDVLVKKNSLWVQVAPGLYEVWARNAGVECGASFLRQYPRKIWAARARELCESDYAELAIREFQVNEGRCNSGTLHTIPPIH